MISHDQIAARLIADEGEVLHAYPDHLGYLTIGVGILIDERKGGGITREESRYLLHNRIERFENQCHLRFAWFTGMNDPIRQQVIVCMVFQLGTDGVAEFKRMIVALKLRDYVTAAAEMIDSQWHKDTPSRCKLMASIMRNGVWP